MARMNNTLWNRYKYKLNVLIILLPFYFIYQSLTPEPLESWPAKKIASFEVTPMPDNFDPPYFHDDHYTKDFSLTFTQGKVSNIRQAYLNIGKEPIALSTLEAGNEGILHGSQHGQEAHAISPKVLKATDKVWLTIADWQGHHVITSWDLPQALLP
ncbi:MAG: hypothetical protein V5789_02325 [Colwellia sp.]